MKLETKKITLIAVLAAVYAVGSFVPGFPMIGVPGSRIDITRSLEMGYGLILGPVLGPLAAFLGALVGKFLTGGGIGLFFTPLALVSSFIAAALGRRNVFNVRGWVLASLISIVLIAGWYVTETGRNAPYYPILHIAALCIILIFRGNLSDFIHSRDKGRVGLGVALCSFPSTMAGHMLGNLIFIVLFKPTSSFFYSILLVSAFERIVLTIFSTMIATTLIIVVRNLFPELMDEV